jgi:hypothetical protein
MGASTWTHLSSQVSRTSKVQTPLKIADWLLDLVTEPLLLPTRIKG